MSHMLPLLVTIVALSNSTEHRLAATELRRCLFDASHGGLAIRVATGPVASAPTPGPRHGVIFLDKAAPHVSAQPNTTTVNAVSKRTGKTTKRGAFADLEPRLGGALCAHDDLAPTLVGTKREKAPQTNDGKLRTTAAASATGTVYAAKGDRRHADTHWHCRRRGGSVAIGGRSDRAVVYGVSALLHAIGFRFYASRDATPHHWTAETLHGFLFGSDDARNATTEILERPAPLPPLRVVRHPVTGHRHALPHVEALTQAYAPAFNIRGLQPFHDFPMGPDWWDENGFRTVVTQEGKSRMNFIGFHTYPVDGPTEPLVWVGTPDQLDSHGKVKPQQGYSAFWTNSLLGRWGWYNESTSNYRLALDTLFPDDCYTSPATPCNETIFANDTATVFNNVGPFLGNTFKFSRANAGVKTCVGNEVPLTTSKVYLNMYFSAVTWDYFMTTSHCQLCPANLQYRLMSENQGVLFSAPQRLVSMNPPGQYTELANYQNNVTGDTWLAVYLPPPMQPAPGYALMDGGAPIGWAFYANRDSRGHYVCPSGTLPLHVYINPLTGDRWTLADPAMQKYALEQGYVLNMSNPWGACVEFNASRTRAPSKREFYRGMFDFVSKNYEIDHYWLWTPEMWEWDMVNVTNPAVATAVSDINDAYAVLTDGGYNFTLGTCGWVLGPAGHRAYLDTAVNPNITLSSIDQDLGWQPVDPSYAEVHNHSTWVIPWMEDDPGIIGAELWVERLISHAQDATSYGISGLLGIHWRLFETEITIHALGLVGWEGASEITAEIVYWDYSATNFGQWYASEGTALFMALDGFIDPTAHQATKIPRPALTCCARLLPLPNTTSQTLSEILQAYAFADQWQNFSATVAADPTTTTHQKTMAKRWAAQFSYQRAMAKVSFYAMKVGIAATYLLQDINSFTKQEEFTSTMYLFSGAYQEMISWLLQFTFTTGELGMVSAHEAMNYDLLAGQFVTQVEQASNGSYALPDFAKVPRGHFPIIPETEQAIAMVHPLWVRTQLDRKLDEAFTVTMLGFSYHALENVTLYWQSADYDKAHATEHTTLWGGVKAKLAGPAGVQSVPLRKVRDAWWEASMGVPSTDFQWRLEADTKSVLHGRAMKLRWPEDEGAWQTTSVVN